MLLQESKLFTKEYKAVIKEALEVLGKKNLALILQGKIYGIKRCLYFCC